MKFESIFWPDSQLVKIQIEYNYAGLVIWNDVLQKHLLVKCSGLAGINNLCIWDDTIIENIYVKNADLSSDSYLQNVFSNYDKDFDCGGRNSLYFTRARSPMEKSLNEQTYIAFRSVAKFFGKENFFIRLLFS